MDGEQTLLSEQQIDGHVAACPGCRQWADAMTAANRRLRVREVVAGPDLSGPILRAALADQPAAPAQPRMVGPLRAGLGLVGLAQLTLGLAQLLGVYHDGMNMTSAGHDHLFNESTAWNIAVGIGLIVAAVWPRTARGFLAPLGVFVAVLTIVSVGDVLTRQVTTSRLESHIFLVVGLVLLFLVDRTVGIPAPGTAERAGWNDDDILAQHRSVLSQPASQHSRTESGRPRRRNGSDQGGRRAA